MQPYNVKTTKKDLINRLQKHNIDAWKNDPLQQEIYALATNPNRTAADDTRFDELRNQQTKRELGFTSTALIKDYPTQAETEAARVLDFTHYINYNQPREKRLTNKK
jgi:hypothetical protein